MSESDATASHPAGTPIPAMPSLNTEDAAPLDGAAPRPNRTFSDSVPTKQQAGRGFWLPYRTRSLLRYAGPYKRRFGMGVVVVILIDVFDVAWPFFLALAIDAITLGTITGTDWSVGDLGMTPIEVALACAGIMVALVALAGWMRYHMIEHFHITATRLARDMRERLHTHLTRLPQSWFTRTNTGEVMSRLTNDVEAVHIFHRIGTLLFVDALAYLLLVPIPMFFFSADLTLICAALMPLIPLIVYRMSKAVHRRFERVQEQFSTVSDRAFESISGIRVVKSFVREAYEATRFQEESQEYRKRFIHLAWVDALFQPVFLTITGIGFFLILLYGGDLVLSGAMTIGAFAAFFTYVIKLTDPMIELGWIVNLYQRATASDRRLTEVLTTEPAIQSPAEGGLAPTDEAFRGEIEVADLTFRYPAPLAEDKRKDEDWRRQRESKRLAAAGLDPGVEDSLGPIALRDLSLTVPAGRTVALMGEVGSGKSTLLQLLPRLFDPPPGTVRLDGADVQQYDLTWLRRQIGYVPQDTFLFSVSIAENIALGRPTATREEVLEAARIAQVDRDVAEFPDGYETMLGERGVNLSGGQKQRVAIARAILKQPRILLLDDCLSAVDSITEEAILRGLRGVMKGRTTLIASHRCSTVMDADRILLLDDGMIVEQGSHSELLALGGRYAALFRAQQGESAA